MPDLMQWSSVVLALLGLFLWLWSAHPMVGPKRPVRRAAIIAAVVSALLQAGLPAPRTHLSNIEHWAFLASSPQIEGVAVVTSVPSASSHMTGRQELI